MVDTGAADFGTSAPGGGGGRKILVGVIAVLIVAVAGLGYALTRQHHETSAAAATAKKDHCPNWYPKGSICTPTTTTPPNATATTVPSNQAEDQCSGCDGSGSGGSSTADTAALLAVLQQTLTSEPASAFTERIDPNDTSWAMWTVNDPTVGMAYGFAQSSGGQWQVVAGPGSDDVGCGDGEVQVPTQVIADLGASCPGGSPTQEAPTVTSQQAYQDGYNRGHESSSGYISGGPSEQSVCDTYVPSNYSSAGLSAEWESGCTSGFETGGSSNATSEAPDVPGYSGSGSYGGDDATGGFSGAP